MDTRKYSLAIIVLLMSLVSWADNQLIDPVTKKTLNYNTTSVKVKSNALNPFEDVDVSMAVIRDNKLCTNAIATFITNLAESEDYKKRLKEHGIRTITHYLKYSDEAKGFSVYDKKLLMDQAILLEDIDCDVVSYYNNILCIRLGSEYYINQNYSRYKEKGKMYQAIYVDVNTGLISTLLDLCPKALRPKFINSLTAEKNRAIPLVNKKNDEVESREAQTDDDYEEEEDAVKYNPKRPAVETEKGLGFLKEKIDLSDLLFDVNAMNFFVMRNSSNTSYTKGNPFVLYIHEDSLVHYLPFTLSRLKEKMNAHLNVQKVNKQLMQRDRPYSFLYNDYSLAYFENTGNKRNVSVFFKQDFISDTAFRLIERLTFTNENALRKSETDFDAKGTARSVKEYMYENNLLKSIELKRNNAVEGHKIYLYNKKGCLIKYLSNPEDDMAEEFNYSYSDLSVTECRTAETGNTCYTYLFDSIGNYLLYYNTGTKPVYPGVYYKSLLMARGDALYSYNAMGQLESLESDGGRYYTSYFYDQQNRMSQVLSYDGKKLRSRQVISYDASGRMTGILQANYNGYSPGKIETQVQYKLVYSN